MGAMDALIFVDCEATGGAPCVGTLTEFGAVHYQTMATFYGKFVDAKPDPRNPAVPLIEPGCWWEPDPAAVWADFENWIKDRTPCRAVFVSDNPAYDFQWINDGFWRHLGRNPFGHSGRRISDFYAGLRGNWSDTQTWKRLRVTPHDHNPVNDAMGNAEAFRRMLAGER